MISSPLQNPRRKWKFTWEALSHTPILRLFLFSPSINPSVHCSKLVAVFRIDQSRLLVSWVQEEEEIRITVPVPRVPIDVGSPVGLVAREDHIEVKLALVLPVDHPIVADFWGAVKLGDRGQEEEGMQCSDPLKGLSLDSDLQFLRTGDTHFYCKTCSTRLTRKCLRDFIELPSDNWKEIADNWFGSCCCTFGAISEKLVSQYITTYACKVGKCLVHPASVIICQDDMERFTILDCNTENAGQNVSSDPADILITNNTSSSELIESFYNKDNNRDAIIPSDMVVNATSFSQFTFVKDGACEKEIANECIYSCCPLQEEVPRTSNEVKTMENQIDLSLLCNPISIFNPNLNATQGTPLLSVGTDEKQTSIGINSMPDCNPVMPFDDIPTAELASMKLHHCSTDKTGDACGSVLSCKATSLQSQELAKQSNHQKRQISSHNGSYGSGFVIKTQNVSVDVRWVEVLCRECSSLLGAYPSNGENIPADGGIRLFKCYISSNIPGDGIQDIFRKHTLQSVFTNLLLESAAEELSFRTIVRSVRTNSPMLKVIIINSKVWCVTGHCFENEAAELDFDVNLQPFVKVLYSDCISDTEVKSSLFKGWSTKHDADEVYMIPCLIQELTEHLNSSRDRLPHSCSLLDGMSLSFMER